MFKPVARILIKLFELFGCIACVIEKSLTDSEARRVALRNQKYSREWSLLINVTWSREGNAFANITYGGFTLITALLLLSRCINSKSRPSLTEKIFLTVGMLFHFAMGGLVYASLEQVPPELTDNAIILGSLSFLVAFLFLIDLGDPLGKKRSNYTQTESTDITQSSTQTQSHTEIKQLNIPNVRLDITPTPSPDVEVVPSNGYYFAGDQVDYVQTRHVPTAQQPVMAKILMPEKKRPTKTKIQQPKRLNVGEDEYPYLAASYLNAGVRRKPSNRKNYISDDDNVDKPIRSGFVAQAARMWDRRARRRDHEELSTIV